MSDEEKIAFLAWAEKTHPAYLNNLLEVSLPLKDDLAFLAWAEKTHPGYLNNLKDGYRRFKEASQ